jgi:RNA polymerase sigma-32 factor
MWWIRAAITEYILKSWSLVKLGTLASQKKLFFSLRNIKRKLNILEVGELEGDQVRLISDAVGISEDEVINMNRRLAQRDMSLNAQVGNDEGGSIEYIDTLVDSGPSPEALVVVDQEKDSRHVLLDHALKQLTDRERLIFLARRLSDEPRTLEDIGNELGISRERVRQLEVRAYEIVENAVKTMAARSDPGRLEGLPA